MWLLVCKDLWWHKFALRPDEPLVVLLHCFGGRNRGPAMACVWLIVGYGYSTWLRFVGLQNAGRCQRRNSGLFSIQICAVLECVSDVRARHAFLTPTWHGVVSSRCFSNSGVRAVFERHSYTVHSSCQKSASLFFELAFRVGMQGRCCKHKCWTWFVSFRRWILAVTFVLTWPVVCSFRPASQHRMDLPRSSNRPLFYSTLVW